MDEEKGLRQKAKNQLGSFLAECGIQDYRGKRILEVGYRNGLCLDECRKAGLVPVGLEINKTYYETVRAKFPHLEALLYDGGTFPLPDASFDFVVSFQVLRPGPFIGSKLAGMVDSHSSHAAPQVDSSSMDSSPASLAIPRDSGLAGKPVR